jgi:anaerobic selenocysteine-containing dehydrogenase
MGISRRGFIKASAVTGATVAGLSANKPMLTAFSETDKKEQIAESGKWLASTCQGCTTWCPVQVYVENGRAIKVRGNPNSKGNHGKICPRPHLAIQQLYDPDRVKVPMKRTNPKKGRNEDPKFVPISWEEAIDAVTDKMMELRKSHETHKFALLRGRYTGAADIFYKALPTIFGSPNNISHSAICAEAEKLGPYVTEAYWDYRDYDLEHTRYVLMWSTDPVSSNRQVPHAISMFGKVLDQAKVAVIDPRLSATASKADEWLPVIPGQDGALVSAIAHVILKEGIWNREFVGDFKDGENLFAKGSAVDEAAFEENMTYGIVKWWNLELKDRTPEWAAEIAGVPAEQIYRVARDFAEAAPRAISWLAPGSAMQIRGGYTSMGAHALNALVGSIENIGGTNRGEKVPLQDIPELDAYLDEIAKKGKKYEKIDQRGRIQFPAFAKGELHKGVITNNVADGILNEDPYDIKMAIGYWNNFVFSCTGAQRWEKAMEKIPFYVHITVNPAEMTQYADIVLPACHQLFERWGVIKSKQNMNAYGSIQQPVIEPLWDCKVDETEIGWLIAESLAKKGFSNIYDYYRNEFVDPETGKKATNEKEFNLVATKFLSKKLWHPSEEKKGDQISSWQEFVDVGVWNAKRTPYKKHWEEGFETASTKFEFYSETLKGLLDEHAKGHNTSIDKVMEAMKYEARGDLAFVPHYEEPIRYGDEKEFPLIFTEHRSRLNREGRSANTTWYQEFKDADPGDEKWDDVIKVNPIDCKKYGVKSGDRVKVTSVQGSIEVTVKEWEGTRPGVAVKCYGQGHWAYGRIATMDYQKKIARGGNNNEILPSDYEHLSGSTARHGGLARIKIEKI